MEDVNINTRNDGLIRLLFFIYLLFIVLEKLSWSFGGWGANIFILFTPILSVILVFLYCASRKKIRISFFDRKFSRYYILFLLYVLLQFITIDHTPNMTTQHIKGFVVLIVEVLSFFNFLMLINYDDHSIDFEFASYCFYVLTIINVLYCVLQNLNPQIDETVVRLFHSTVVRYGTDRYGAMDRPTGLFIESNFNGPFLVIGFINELYFCKNKLQAKVLLKMIGYVFIAITAFEIFLTLSLTTYIGFAVYGLYVFAKSNINNKGRWLLLAILLFAAGLHLYSTNHALQIAVVSKFSTFDSIDTLRRNSHYLLAVQSLKIFFLNLRNIIFGTGYNCLNVFFQEVFGYVVMKAHNYYLQRLCELGLLGFSLTIYYISTIWKAGTRRTKEGDLLKAMFISMLSMNFTYDAFTRNYNIIFVILAMLIYNHKTESDMIGE